MLNDMMKLEGRVVPNYLKPYAQNLAKNKKYGTSGFNKRQQ
jgi:hypothetical protein